MRHRDELKAQAILAATLDEVQSVGLAGLSIEAVAQRAGVATGTVYVYFKNKDALLNALYLLTKARFAEFVLRDEGLPIRAAFSTFARSFMDYVIQHNAEFVFMTQIANSPVVTDQSREAGALGARAIRQLLDRAKSEGLLKDLDTGWMMTFLNGALRDMAVLAIPMSGNERAVYQERVATLCWDALKA
jgi:TetR/AcrR family transcriptional regulator, repressor of fatR-cypB operon